MVVKAHRRFLRPDKLTTVSLTIVRIDLVSGFLLLLGKEFDVMDSDVLCGSGQLVSLS